MPDASILALTARALPTEPDNRDRASAADTQVPFQQAVAVTLARLQSVVVEFLAAVPAETRRAADVERAFGVDPKLGWQLHKIATSSNPLALGANVPAPVSVQRLLKAGAKMGLSTGILERTSGAFNDVERLIEEHAGDRERFASMMGALMRDDGEDLDLKYKKAAYRAMSHLRGVDTRAYVRCWLLHPGASPDMLTAAMVRVAVGLHQLRPAAPLILPLGGVRASEKVTSDQYHEASADPIPGAAEAYLLREFSSPNPLPEMRVLGLGTAFPALEVPEGLGRKQSVTVATAAVTHALSPYATPGDPWIAHLPKSVLPSEVLIGDTLLHKDLSPVRHPIVPKVQVFDNERIGAGSGEPEHTERTDLLSVRETCEYLGLSVDLLGTPDVPRYVEMVKSVCAIQKWNPDDFHVYRCVVRYPILHSTIRIFFDLKSR